MKKLGWFSIVAVVLLLGLLAACTSSGGNKNDSSNTSEVAKPSNAGGPGPAASMQGDANAGATVYEQNCKQCHGDQGKGGVANPGSDDGTVPPLNPIDSTLKSSDYKTFATNIDLFIEHGSKPEGSNPALQMKAFGDQKLITTQQIADVIAYVISLNK